MRRFCPSPHSRRGVMIVVTAVLLVVLIGFAGLTIDVGLMYLAKAELQNAADAAALAAIRQLEYGGSANEADSAVSEEAYRYAKLNSVLGSPVRLSTAADVVIGAYDVQKRVFQAGASPADTVRVTARRTRGSADGPIPLHLMTLLGHGHADVAASTTVMLQVNCYTRGVRARTVTIAAQSTLDGLCIYGRNRVHIAAQAEAIDTTYVASLDASDIKFAGEMPEGFEIKEGDILPEAADEVREIIDGLESGVLVPPGMTVVWVGDGGNGNGKNAAFDLGDMTPETIYIFDDDATFTGGDVTIEEVTLAVRGNVTFGPGTVLRNGALPGGGATALSVLAEGRIHFSNRAGLEQGMLISGDDVHFAANAEIFEGAIEASGTVHLAAKAAGLNEGYAMPYGSVSADPVMLE